MMFVILLATLLFCVRGSDADSGASEWEKKSCYDNFCITLNKGEITAEAGLCAVIPCSFSSRADFTATDLTWMKCEPFDQRCFDSHRIFHTKNSDIPQITFKGRVSLLEPDVSLGNCSIIINDLTESDSGSYQLRIIGNTPQKNGDGFTFTPKPTVSVKDLTQKPTVKVPPLTAGQQTTLTCIAPGLCSGSKPEITWMWRGAGGKHITGNITAFKTESLTSVTQTHSSTLTFNPSAKHHGTKVTCKVSFKNNISTEETVTLNVTFMKKPVITGNTSLVEGHALNLTCSVKSFPPSRITWTKNGSNTNLHSQPDTNMSNNSDSATLFIQNVTRNDSGRFICTAEHQDRNVTVFADITVTYFDEPKITGKTSVVEGHALNLTCSVKSFPPSLITLTKLSANTNLHSQPDANMSNNSDSVTLFIQNVTRDDSGRFICTAEHQDRNVTVFADITVTLFPKILQNSECKVQLNVLTCVCITEGFPLPNIKWPLLKNHTEYSVMTTVSDHTVNSTITLTMKDHSSTTVECVSANENGEATKNLIMQTDTSDEKDKLTDVLTMVSWLEVVIAFLTGVLLSTVICCFIRNCHRKKQKSFEDVDETMEMIDGGQAVREEGRAGAGEKAALKLNSGPEDLHYASIDFSLLKRKSPREEAKMPEKTETEYAEVKREVKEKEEDNSRDRGEILDVQEEETKHGVTEEDKEEDTAVYSNVKDVMSEI